MTGNSAQWNDTIDRVDPGWAWAPYEPGASRPWTMRLAGHLYRRVACGANLRQLEQAVADGPQATVDGLVNADASAFNQSFDRFEAATTGAEGLRAWWLRRMIETPHPLLERMTLFWHSHFGISVGRVGNAPLVAQHVRTLRSHAMGKYAPLLEAMSSDPAVFLGLGADTSHKAIPNENFARQLMEQLSLGPGHFDEEDVREAARAFTGWFVLRGKLRFFDREHDRGVKNVLGRKGNWQAEDVVRIVLEQPATPRMLARKLFSAFISEVDPPRDALLDPLVTMLADDLDVGQVVETMLRSNLFFSPAAYRRRIKSPVDFAVGIVKGLNGTVSTTQLGADLARTGQDLYHPPTVHGWSGGRHWLNAVTLVARNKLAQSLLQPAGPYGGKLDPREALNNGAAPDAAAEQLIDLFLQGDLAAAEREALFEAVGKLGADPSGPWLRTLTYAVVSLPEFQLC